MGTLGLLAASASVAYASTSFSESGDAGQTLGSAQAVSAGTTSISGTLQLAGDVDLYVMEFDTSASVTFQTSGNDGLDDNMILFSASGTPLFGNDDFDITLDSRIVWNVTPGTYYLAIGENNLNATDGTTVICDNDDGDCSASMAVLGGWDAAGGLSNQPYVISISAPTSAMVSAASIPTLSEWGMLIMAALLGGSMILAQRRTKPADAA